MQTKFHIFLHVLSLQQKSKGITVINNGSVSSLSLSLSHLIKAMLQL